MSASRTQVTVDNSGPSVFALLIDNIQQMSEAEQKTLWVQINSDKVGAFARELDAATVPHNFSDTAIATLITEALSNAKNKQKG